MHMQILYEEGQTEGIVSNFKKSYFSKGEEKKNYGAIVA